MQNKGGSKMSKKHQPVIVLSSSQTYADAIKSASSVSTNINSTESKFKKLYFSLKSNPSIKEKFLVMLTTKEAINQTKVSRKLFQQFLALQNCIVQIEQRSYWN